MFLDFIHHEFMIYVVEESFDIYIYDPIIFPTSSSSHLYGF